MAYESLLNDAEASANCDHPHHDNENDPSLSPLEEIRAQSLTLRMNSAIVREQARAAREWSQRIREAARQVTSARPELINLSKAGPERRRMASRPPS